MTEATFVIFASRAQRERLRAHLDAHSTETVAWSERRSLFGSEFSVRGPARDAREAHALAAGHLAKSSGWD